MQDFVNDELEKLGTSQIFLQEKMKAFGTSEQEVNEQTAKARDDMNEVLEEISTLREDVKQKVGDGLNELSAAAEKISASIITELDKFQSEVGHHPCPFAFLFWHDFADSRSFTHPTHRLVKNSRVHSSI
jgi:kinesin family protein 11